MNLLQSELIEHGKVLASFSKLPRDLKQLILTFYKSSKERVPYEPFCMGFLKTHNV